MSETLQYYGAAWKAAQGPRPELQDLPFCLRLTWVGDRYTAFDPSVERSDDDRRRDLVIAGILDGMGGTAIPLDLDRVPGIAPFLELSGLISERFGRKRGRFLTGRAASRFLLRALERRAVKLTPEPADSFGLSKLVARLHADLLAFNDMMTEWKVTSGGAGERIGSALSLSVTDALGNVAYANCGDCRGALLRGDGTIEELSSKQTLAAMTNVDAGTTVGLADDGRILNALGVFASLEPAFNRALIAEGDVLLHMTDGAKEALMYNPALEAVPWTERNLPVTLERTAWPLGHAGGRVFPALHRLFKDCVMPFVAEAGTPGLPVAKVLDNVALLAQGSGGAVACALDRLYQGVDSGEIAFDRSRLELSQASLDELAVAAELRLPEQREALRNALGEEGFTISAAA